LPAGCFAFQACTIEKRTHRSGYHIEWTKQKNQTGGTASVAKQQQETAPVLSEKIEDTEITAGAEKTQAIFADNSIDISPLIAKKKFKSFAQECDNIILQNGEEVMARVLEVTVEEIKYKRCDNLDGPVYSIKKADVFMIKYANGTKDIFATSNNTAAKASQTKYQGKPKDDPLGVIGMIVGVIAWLVPTFPLALLLCTSAVMFAVASLSRIKKYPEKYKGRGFSYVALGLGIAGLLILLAAGANTFN
jgi:hypothetical protein